MEHGQPVLDLLPEQSTTRHDPISLRHLIELEQHEAIETLDELPLVHGDAQQDPVAPEVVEHLVEACSR